MSDLNHNLLVVSAAQILRAAGFDRAKPMLLDIVAELMARYLILLGSTSANIAALNNRTFIQMEDARLAMEQIGLFAPTDVFSNEEDRRDENRSVVDFIDWAKGRQVERLRKVAGMERLDFLGLSADSNGEDWFTSKYCFEFG